MWRGKHAIILHAKKSILASCPRCAISILQVIIVHTTHSHGTQGMQGKLMTKVGMAKRPQAMKGRRPWAVMQVMESKDTKSGGYTLQWEHPRGKN